MPEERITLDAQQVFRDLDDQFAWHPTQTRTTGPETHLEIETPDINIENNCGMFILRFNDLSPTKQTCLCELLKRDSRHLTVKRMAIDRLRDHLADLNPIWLQTSNFYGGSVNAWLRDKLSRMVFRHTHNRVQDNRDIAHSLNTSPWIRERYHALNDENQQTN